MSDIPAMARVRPKENWLVRLSGRLGAEIVGLLMALVAVIVFFGATAPQFLSMDTFNSMAFQLP